MLLPLSHVSIRPWVLAMVLLAGAACRAHSAGTTAPATGDASHGKDADRLPAFEISDGAHDRGNVPHERFRVELGDAPLRGAKDAPVTVVMFSDFECQYCLQAYRMLEVLGREYPNQIRLAYKAFPLDFHSHAMLAALAARSAQAQGKFWPFFELLFSGEGIDPHSIEGYARTVGLDMATLRRDLDNLEWAAEVRRDMRDGRRFGVTGTPAFFINGRHIHGAQSIAVFRAVIEQELALANKWLAAGVSASGIYEHAIAEGYREVRYTKASDRLDPDHVRPVVLGESPQLGPADAPVTIVIFGDFECPFCARGQVTIDKLRAKFKDRVRLVYKHNPLPFHSHAFMAARAAMAAHAQGKFWAYHDALYQAKAKLDDNTFYTIAKRLKLDMERFRADLESTKFDARISADQALSSSLGATGTPAYFINGRPLEGAMPELEFLLLIAEELGYADRLRARGVEPSKLYDVLVQRKRWDDPVVNQ